MCTRHVLPSAHFMPLQATFRKAVVLFEMGQVDKSLHVFLHCLALDESFPCAKRHVEKVREDTSTALDGLYKHTHTHGPCCSLCSVVCQSCNVAAGSVLVKVAIIPTLNGFSGLRLRRRRVIMHL